MISVCIPVYNNDVTKLVAALLSQIDSTQIQCEILLFDDGSDDRYVLANQPLTNKEGVICFDAGKNLGRIEARKALAARARFDWLLFMDSDSRIIKSDFLISYLNKLNETVDIVVGGRVYPNEKPDTCHKILHWKYGRCREKTDDRLIFMTNNFCIRKSIFNQIHFPKTLQGYGHEDTWMGIQLKQLGSRMVFIANPVLHAGIEDATTFISKSEQALHNVAALELLVPQKDLERFIKLYYYYRLQQRWHLSWFLILLEELFHSFILKNLTSCYPHLWLFDFYRLVYFIKINQQSSNDSRVVKRN